MTKVTQAHVDARTDGILMAAEKLFAMKGIDRTTMQEIAAEAGISAGAIYRYFPSKELLLEAALRNGQSESAALFAQAATRPGSPLDALLGVGQEVLDGEECQEPELWLECALAALRDPDGIGLHHRELVERTIEGIKMMLARASAAGEISAALDLPSIALLLYCATLGLKALGPDRAAAGRDALGVAVRMLRATADAPGAGPTGA